MSHIKYSEEAVMGPVAKLNSPAWRQYILANKEALLRYVLRSFVALSLAMMKIFVFYKPNIKQNSWQKAQ